MVQAIGTLKTRDWLHVFHLSPLKKKNRFAPPQSSSDPKAQLAYQRRSLGTIAAKSRAIWEKQFTNRKEMRFGKMLRGVSAEP
jgi:hypothetical protein